MRGCGMYMSMCIYIYMPEALNSFVSELHFCCSHLVSSPPVHCHLHRHLSFGHHVGLSWFVFTWIQGGLFVSFHVFSCLRGWH